MEWQERMNRAIAHMEAHLAESADWEAVAREACCSAFHFMRMFRVVTGMTAGE